MSAQLLSRVARRSLLPRVCQVEDTIRHFEHGMSIGWSGFSPAGYPKAVPLALARHVEANNLQGKLQFDLFAGASVGSEVEDRWCELEMTRRRWPYQSGKKMHKAINTGKVLMGDIHLSKFAHTLNWGFFTKGAPGARAGRLDVGIIEVTEIRPEGLVLGAGIGIAPEIVDCCDKLIIEVNTSIPSYYGLHDVVPDAMPPHRSPFLITRPDDRIGSRVLPFDLDKVVAVVESQLPDRGNAFSPPEAEHRKIAGFLLDFFESEVRAGRMPKNLLPLQSGVGNIANAVVDGLRHGPFDNISVWTEVLQDTMLDFFDSGKLKFASTAAMSLSEPGFKRFYERFEEYRSKIIIRPQQITNHPEMVRRLGVVAMNTPVEVDIYGHANSTLVNGTQMMHGLGGSGDFLRSGYLSILHLPSARRTKTDPTGISGIVTSCAHIDHTEHDIDVIVTEQGLADLRGLTPRERARSIIKNCAHPDYVAQLTDYLDFAERRCIALGIGHEPQVLDRMQSMHVNSVVNGTMKLKTWDFDSSMLAEKKAASSASEKK